MKSNKMSTKGSTNYSIEKRTKTSSKTVATKTEQSSVEEKEQQTERRKETVTTTYDFEAEWERMFVANIESAKTLPYISLLKFKFIQINFDAQSEIDKESIVEVKKTASPNLYARFKGFVQDFKAVLLEDIKEKRRKYIIATFNVDDGPFVYDYNAELGLECWSRYCNIDKITLKQSVATGFWDRREDSYRDSKENLTQMMNEKKGILKALWNSFGLPIVFLQGFYEPVRAPQKVISPEERFCVQSLAKIKRASEDIIPPKEYKTYIENIEKQILNIYKWVVGLMGGKWPRIRQHTLEEINDDALVWILDVEHLKERILAILNDRIKKVII